MKNKCESYKLYIFYWNTLILHNFLISSYLFWWFDRGTEVQDNRLNTNIIIFIKLDSAEIIDAAGVSKGLCHPVPNVWM